MSPAPVPVIREVASSGDVACPLATETVVATLNGISTEDQSTRIDLHGFVQFLAGVGATTATLRIRRGVDATGALVGEGNPINTPASVATNLDIDVQDVPGAVAGQSYVLTCTAAGVAGTSQQEQLRAIVGVN